MRSSLLRKLSLIDGGAPEPKKPEIRHVKLYEWSCPAEEGLGKLHLDALSMMGFDGQRFDLSRTVFIDTETTGLSGGAGTVAFLTGIGYVQNDRFTVKQYLMPDYSAEAEMLQALSEEFSRFETAVHFNGRRFDIPLLSQRCVMKRMDDFTKGLWQLDLLYPARSVWKLRIGSCRLSYIESRIMDMPERDDIPGSEIPSRYFESVRTGDIGLLKDVIEHNRQDIVTLTKLLVKLEGMYAAPEEVSEQIDIFSLGRVFERQGEYRIAKKLYLKASRPRAVFTLRDLESQKYAGEANLRLYHIERRACMYDKCELTLLNMIKRGQYTCLARLELCKLYEHRLHRYSDALRQCEILLKGADDAQRPLLMKRKNRILIKYAKHGGYMNV